MIHENLYDSEDLSKVHLSNYLQSLVDYMNSSHAPAIELVVESEELQLGVDKTMPFALIAYELLAHCLRQLQGDAKSKICLHLASDQNNASLSFRSDPPSQSNESSLGVDLASSLVSQIQGTLESKSESHDFRVVFAI